VIAQHADDFSKTVVIGGNHAAFPSRNGLPRMKRKAANGAQATSWHTQVSGPSSTGTVFHQRDVARDGPNGIHIGAQAKKMHRDDGPGTGRDAAAQVRWVDIEGLRVHVDKDDLGPAIFHHISR
jgi:hypothetical protein